MRLYKCHYGNTSVRRRLYCIHNVAFRHISGSSKYPWDLQSFCPHARTRACVRELIHVVYVEKLCRTFCQSNLSSPFIDRITGELQFVMRLLSHRILLKVTAFCFSRHLKASSFNSLNPVNGMNDLMKNYDTVLVLIMFARSPLVVFFQTDKQITDQCCS